MLKSLVFSLFVAFGVSSAMADGMSDAEPADIGVAIDGGQKAVQPAKPAPKKAKSSKAGKRACSVDPNVCACQLLGARTKLSGAKGQEALIEFAQIGCDPALLPKGKRKPARKG